MLAELIFDFLPWPTRSGGLSDRIAERLDSGSFRPEVPGSIKRALNESGCLDEEVIAAGELMQGVEPSLVSMVTGLALIELARPRRSKSLPRNFVLAVTADRVVAFKARAQFHSPQIISRLRNISTRPHSGIRVRGISG